MIQIDYFLKCKKKHFDNIFNLTLKYSLRFCLSLAVISFYFSKAEMKPEFFKTIISSYISIH